MRSKANGVLDDSPTHLFHRVAQRINQMYEEQTKASLTPRQICLLATLAQNEGLSQTGLVNLTDIDRSTLADIVSRLQKKGLVRRRRVREDKRTYSVKLTEEGWRVVRASEPVMRRVDELILSPLAERQRAKLVSDLKTIVVALQSSPPARNLHRNGNKQKPAR